MIYVHVPFCKSFCTYCDFYSENRCTPLEIKRYLECIKKEISSRREEIDNTGKPDTLFIGGGTPSVLPLAVLQSIVEAIGKASYQEFTIEVNPEDIVTKGLDYACSLKALGVNRVSMGVQSLDNKVLRWMNRRHNGERALEAFGILREAGFDNISVDVIFGLSILENRALKDTLDRLIDLRPEHISSYQLMIEEGTPVYKLIEEGKYVEAGDDYCREQYDLICSILREAGYHHYEISNWALPGRESLHNSAYWERVPYVGLGPGAHSFSIEGDVQKRSWNSEQLYEWTSSFEILSPKEIREERLMLGLRTDKGVDGRTIPESDWFISDTIISELF